MGLDSGVRETAVAFENATRQLHAVLKSLLVPARSPTDLFRAQVDLPVSTPSTATWIWVRER
jgi:hypothetical protein